MVQRTWIIIPARAGSTRFPNKPLASVAGRRVLDRAIAVAQGAQTLHPGIEKIIVATDSERISEAAQETPGIEVWNHAGSYRNGTERCAGYMKHIETTQGSSALPQWIVNLQGDALLTPPWAITTILAQAQKGAHPYATGGLQLTWDAYERLRQTKASGKASGTFVVMNPRGQALYFSKAPIPALKNPPPTSAIGNPTLSPFWRHIGVYIYQTSLLGRLAALPPTPLEALEDLEQLRALEHGYALQVVPVDYRGRSHDSLDYPEDLARIEQVIQREGELTP